MFLIVDYEHFLFVHFNIYYNLKGQKIKFYSQQTLKIFTSRSCIACLVHRILVMLVLFGPILLCNLCKAVRIFEISIYYKLYKDKLPIVSAGDEQKFVLSCISTTSLCVSTLR